VKRLLLFVCIVGAAVYLLAPASRPTNGTLEAVSAVQTQTNQQIRRPLSSSWGSTLRSLRGDQEAWVSPQPPTSLKPLGSEPTPHVEMQGSRLTRVTQYAVQPDQVSVTTDETERDVEKWVRMTQAVRVRSEASVYFPGLQVYPAGSKAQIVGRKNGWVEVLDPTTNERGWVYHSYLASIDAPGAANPEADSNVPLAKVASPTSPKSTPTAKSTVRTSDAATVTKAKRRHERQAWRAERRRGLGLFKRRQAQRAWSLGPAR